MDSLALVRGQVCKVTVDDVWLLRVDGASERIALDWITDVSVN